MYAKDLIRSLQTNLEREILFTDKSVSVFTDLTQELPMAKISIQVEGRVKIIEVIARDLGWFDGVVID